MEPPNQQRKRHEESQMDGGFRMNQKMVEVKRRVIVVILAMM